MSETINKIDILIRNLNAKNLRDTARRALKLKQKIERSNKISFSDKLELDQFQAVLNMQ